MTELPKPIEAIKMMWVKDMPIDFRKLSDLIPNRIEKVLADKGHMTKY